MRLRAASGVPLAVAFTAILAGCAQKQNWSFVRSTGGIAVGTPQRAGQLWVLPIEADVSGLDNVTTQAIHENSGLVCKEVRARVENHNLYRCCQTKCDWC
jgi:hypothetical protein